MKLHLGCGKRHLPGYVHVDVIPFDHLDHVADISRLDFIGSDAVDEVYASHVLEHFKQKDIPRVLQEWRRVLKPHGTLRLAVPDFAAIVKRYQQTGTLDGLQGLLFGGQSYEYNFHHIAFDLASITALLTRQGFSGIETYDWKAFLPAGYDDYSRAYLPHMDQTGLLMSLNIIARKVTPP